MGTNISETKLNDLDNLMEEIVEQAYETKEVTDK